MFRSREKNREKKRERDTRIYIFDTSETWPSSIGWKNRERYDTKAYFRAYFWPTIIDKRAPARESLKCYCPIVSVILLRLKTDDTFFRNADKGMRIYPIHPQDLWTFRSRKQNVVWSRRNHFTLHDENNWIRKLLRIFFFTRPFAGENSSRF